MIKCILFCTQKYELLTFLSYLHLSSLVALQQCSSWPQLQLLAPPHAFECKRGGERGVTAVTVTGAQVRVDA
jgi:hypothetical protein